MLPALCAFASEDGVMVQPLRVGLLLMMPVMPARIQLGQDRRDRRVDLDLGRLQLLPEGKGLPMKCLL